MPPEWIQRFQGILGNFTDRVASRGQELTASLFGAESPGNQALASLPGAISGAFPEPPPELQALVDFLSSDAATAMDFALPQVGAVGRLARPVANVASEQFARHMRRESMGFNTPAYHWTSSAKDFKQFTPWSHFGTKQAAIDRGDAMRRGPLNWRAIGPEMLLEKERTIPVMLRGKYLEFDDLGGWPGQDLASHTLSRLAYPGPLPIGYKQYKQQYKQLEDAMIMAGAQPYKRDRGIEQLVQEVLQQRGYAGLRYVNQSEDIGSISYLVFDPERNVRSPIARFVKERGDLLAGMAGTAFVGAAGSRQ